MKNGLENRKVTPGSLIKWFGKIRIKQKLVLIIMIVSLASMLIASGSFLIYERIIMQQRMASDLSALVEMLADNCEAALSFNDPTDAKHILSSLKAVDSIAFASIYQADGTVFATYQRSDFEMGKIPEPQSDGYHFGKDWLVIFKQISLGGKPIGTAYLQSDLSAISEFLRQSLITLGVVVMFSALFAYYLAIRLQRVVSTPIFHLSETAAAISKNRDYSIRASIFGEDELGVLTAAFNEMLSEVEKSHSSIRDSERKFRTLVDNIPVKVFMKDKESVYLSCNPSYAADLDISPEEISGKTDYDYYPVGVAEKYRADDKRIIESGKREDIEEEFIQHGRHCWVQTIKIPIMDDANNVTGILGVFWDITERKLAEEMREIHVAQLENQSAELERFTYTVSHDLRSPIITIKGFLGELIKDAEEGDIDRLHGDIKRISTAATKMGNLLEDLLNLSRIGRIADEPVDVSLDKLAHEVAESLHGPISERGVRLEIESDLPIVRGDHVRLHEVMQNLIENAIKFMGDQTRPGIQVGSRCVDDETIIYVRDNGQGIDPVYLDKIFGLFEQLDGKTEGTGIGLALVKRIIEYHGGRIWVESEGPECGSSFCFTIPLKGVS